MILDVDWDLLSRTVVPESIRALVEGRLAVLWRFLDSSRVRTASRGSSRWRSEDFQMSVGNWTFIYAVDLATGAAIVTRAAHFAG